MGKASIRADLDDISGLVQQWTQAHGFSCPKSSINTSDQQAKPPAGSFQLKSRSAFFKARWQCQQDAAGYIVDICHTYMSS